MRAKWKPAFVSAFIAAGVVGPAPLPALCSQLSASIVVRMPDGSESSRCVAMPEAEVSGLQVLRLSGLPIVTKDFGGSLGSAVCQINGQGNDSPDCPGSAGHWHYWHLVDGTWEESQVGAGAYTVHARAVEGWAWASGTKAIPPASKPSGDCEPLIAQGKSSEPASVLPVFRYAAFLALAMGLVGTRYLLRRRRAS